MSETVDTPELQKFRKKWVKEIKNKKCLTIKPIPVPVVDPTKVLGYKIFPELYSNIFMCAKKKSGKTTVIAHILKYCINKNTKVFIFSSTVEKDYTWISITKWMDSKKIYFETFDDLEPLDEIVHSLLVGENSSLVKHAKKADPTYDIMDLFTINPPIPPKDTKDKNNGPIAPEYVFIFDDMSALLRNESVSSLLKKNRHIKCKVLISSQYPNDLNIPARQMLDYWLLFAGHPIAKLMEMFKTMDLDITFDEFVSLYKKATSEKYGFLYIDIREAKFRQCFNKPLEI